MRAAKYLVVLVLLLGGCTAPPAASPSPAPSPTPSVTLSGPRPITRLTAFFGPAEFPRSGRLEITEDGVRSRTRYLNARDPDDLEGFTGSDGTTRVVCDSLGCRRYEVVPESESEAVARQCPNGTQTGTGEFIGRRTTIWTCTRGGDEPTEAVFDAEYPGVLLKATLNGGYQWEAASFEIGVEVPPGFFAIDRPGLKWVKPHPTEPMLPKPGVMGEVLPAFGGGTIRMTDYTRGPGIIVYGDEDEVRGGLPRIERLRSGSRTPVVGIVQLPSGPGDYLPKRPFPAPVALYHTERDGDLWLLMVGDHRTPVGMFCRAAGKGCTAVAIPELSDPALAAEIATLG